MFPIEDYDQLRVTQILPLLPELYDDELDVVEARERARKGRVRVLNRIEELRREPRVNSDQGPDPEESSESAAAADDDDDDYFPIVDYDELTVGEIIPLLPELYDDELDVVEDHERATKGRAVILNRLAELRDQGMPD
ncbi:MAG TPA: hypothetical protein VK975_05480, partial [Acidimicrobiales bacterium]|nr:hypothetical protein [Acidimicrobiales bacterium]